MFACSTIPTQPKLYGLSTNVPEGEGPVAGPSDVMVACNVTLHDPYPIWKFLLPVGIFG